MWQLGVDDPFHAYRLTAATDTSRLDSSSSQRFELQVEILTQPEVSRAWILDSPMTSSYSFEARVSARLGIRKKKSPEDSPFGGKRENNVSLPTGLKAAQMVDQVKMHTGYQHS